MAALKVCSATVLDSFMEVKVTSASAVLPFQLRDLKYVHGAIFMAHFLSKVPINISLNTNII